MRIFLPTRQFERKRNEKAEISAVHKRRGDEPDTDYVIKNLPPAALPVALNDLTAILAAGETRAELRGRAAHP
jgi:hypothetical protein